MTEKLRDKAWASPRINPNDPGTGKFFATFNLTGRLVGVLNVYIRLKQSKHYEIYERRTFPNAASAGRWLEHLEPGCKMYVIDPFFK